MSQLTVSILAAASLRLWSGLVIAANRPGFYEAQEAALTGTGGEMLMEDYIRLRRNPG